MAAWSRDNMIVEHRRWTLRLPANIEDVYDTLASAQHSRDRDREIGSGASSLKMISGTETEDGDLMIVFYTVEHRGNVRVREAAPHPGGVELKDAAGNVVARYEDDA